MLTALVHKSYWKSFGSTAVLKSVNESLGVVWNDCPGLVLGSTLVVW